MRPTAQSSDASLLFAAPLVRDVASEISELTRCLDSLGWPVETTRAAPGGVLMLNCGAVQVTIAQSALPLELDDFRGVARPDPGQARDAMALNRLQGHQAYVTVLVADSRAASCPAPVWAKQTICWKITDLIAGVLGADLVFWSATDMLYFADEFAGARPDQTGGMHADQDAGDYASDIEEADLPMAEGPGLDFLDPLTDDRHARPDIVCRFAQAGAESIVDAELCMPDRIGAAMGERRARDYASFAMLALVGFGLASLSALNGLVPLK